MVERVFTSKHGNPVRIAEDTRVRYGLIRDAAETIDDVLISRVSAASPPAVDLSSHGGIRVVQRLVSLLEREGAQLERDPDSAAFVWPARNLIETEAQNALTRAKTERAVRFLAWQRTHLPDRILELAARTTNASIEVARELRGMCSRFKAAHVLLNGSTVVIAGPTNAGKSTLFNRLAGRSSALTSPEAGTTRDWVSQELELGGVPVTLIDTAGWNASLDPMATQTTQTDRRAGICLLVLDGTAPPVPASAPFWKLGETSPHAIVLVNKSDLGAPWTVETVAREHRKLHPPLRISAETGGGVDELVRALLNCWRMHDLRDSDPALFTARQVAHAEAALSDIDTGESHTDRRILRVLNDRSPCEISDVS